MRLNGYSLYLKKKTKKKVTAWWPGMHVSSEEGAWSLFLLSLTVNMNLVIHTDLFLAKKNQFNLFGFFK